MLYPERPRPHERAAQALARGLAGEGGEQFGEGLASAGGMGAVLQR